jgi:hypothetical protein
MTHWSSLQSGAFEPEEIAAMGEAYEATCKEPHDTGQPQIVREVIALRIIAAAKLGERNPVRLRETTLRRLFGEGDY